MCANLCISASAFLGAFLRGGALFFSLFVYFVLCWFVCFCFTLFYFCCVLNVYLFSKEGKKERV